MQLSDPTGKTGLYEDINFLLDTDANSYPNDDKKRNINKWYQKVHGYILNSMDEWDFNSQIATTSLVANQQEYRFPTSILKIKRVEITYDGTNWYKAEPMDLAERGSVSDSTTVNNDFDTTEPFYDTTDNSLFLYPIPTAASSSGLKIWYEEEITELSATTDEPNIPELYQRILSFGASLDYAIKEELTTKINIITIQLNEMIDQLKKYYGSRSVDRNMIMKPLDQFDEYE